MLHFGRFEFIGITLLPTFRICDHRMLVLSGFPLVFLAPIYRILGRFRRDTVIAALITVPIALSGCSAGLGLWPVLQSHLTAAETKLVPIGESQGTAGDFFVTWGGLPNFLHPDLQEEAVRKAIRAKEGDLLINYTLSVRVTRFPLGLLLIDLNAWWITWTAEGIAVKVQPVNPASD